MMKRSIITCFIVFAALSCKQKYLLPGNLPSTGYLVVEGAINSGSGPTTIHLSRTIKIADTASVNNELHATLIVEGNDNSSYPLTETGNGIYSLGQLALSNTRKYRLHIKTTDNKEYLSDFTAVKNTPAIDSITWYENNGVHIYINAHDATGNTRYYRWEFEETWEYHSTFQTNLKYTRDSRGEVSGVEYRFPTTIADFTLYRCWRSGNSSGILIGSSAKLSQDLIYLPLQFIEKDSWKLSVLYSINVRQYALTPDEYDFYTRMKKNTENFGSLFDSQPSELNGNIHCITNPAEVVIGYIGITNPQEKRIYISKGELPDWNYQQECNLIEVQNNPDSIRPYNNMIPTGPSKFSGFFISAFFVSDAVCVDCTIRGTNVKPAFWP